MIRASRRRVLAMGAAAAGSLAWPSRARAADRMPVIFVSHGGPQIAVDPVAKEELGRWGRSLPTPKGIVAVTPHYRAPGFEIGHVGRGKGRYDFPRRFLPDLHADYTSPDNTALAARVSALLEAKGPVARSAGREGFDHTTWMPLLHLRPQADVPVVEIAMPFSTEQPLLDLGKALAPLRDEGVLVMASGGLTHNLASIDFDGPPKLAPWAQAFDAWCEKTLLGKDTDALLAWRREPSAALAHPDDGGHFRVLLVAVGAAIGSASSYVSAKFPVTGITMGTMSKRSAELA